MCGEKCDVKAIGTPDEGSPPHVRGKVCGFLLLPGGQRITPAYAGKSAVAIIW